jgi:hypothetical protein
MLDRAKRLLLKIMTPALKSKPDSNRGSRTAVVPLSSRRAAQFPDDK